MLSGRSKHKHSRQKEQRCMQQVAISFMRLICVSPEVPILRTLLFVCLLLTLLFVAYAVLLCFIYFVLLATVFCVRLCGRTTISVRREGAD